MKKIIAAVDFSEPSVNAAKYAIQLAKDIEASLVLLYAYNPIIAGSDGTPLYIDNEERRTIAVTAINNLKNGLTIPEGLEIETVVEEGAVVQALETYVKRHKADLIVMGITGTSKIEQLVIGSNTLQVVSKELAPVFIIPAQATYAPIKYLALTTDFKDVESSTPVTPLKSLLEVLQPQLQVVHVSETHTSLNEDEKAEKDKLEKMLAAYKPSFYYILEEDFNKGINHFVEEFDTDVIVTVPRKHGFFSRIFKPSYTKQLAFNSQIPIVAIHSWK